jgi:hypothetical protein
VNIKVTQAAWAADLPADLRLVILAAAYTERYGRAFPMPVGKLAAQLHLHRNHVGPLVREAVRLGWLEPVGKARDNVAVFHTRIGATGCTPRVQPPPSVAHHVCNPTDLKSLEKKGETLRVRAREGGADNGYAAAAPTGAVVAMTPEHVAELQEHLRSLGAKDRAALTAELRKVL